jgi:ABC-2 type transport system ATP-binding protein
MTSPAFEAIAVTDLAKRYPDGTEAVHGVSFSVDCGEIVGLVGPNGAGKSTVLNMLATLVTSTSGAAHVFGISVSDRAAVRPLLGVALQATGLDPLMTVRDHFAVHAALYGLPAKAAATRAGELLDVFQLGPTRERRAGELSGGTQRRVSLALSLLHRPRALVFDEPTVGLDPAVRRGLWELLEDLRSQGLAVLFSTHYMDEADRLCQRIELLSGGRIVASGTPEELKARVATGGLRLRIRDGADRAEAALGLAADHGILRSRGIPTVHDGVIDVEAEPGRTSISGLISILEEFGIEVVDLHWREGSLDDVFVRLADGTADEEPLPSVMTEHRVLARRGGHRRGGPRP